MAITVRVLGSATLVGILVTRLDVPRIGRSMAAVDELFLAACAFLVLIGVLVSALRWKVLLSALGIIETYSNLIATYLAGMFFNNLLPTSIGGDVYRSVHLGRRHSNVIGVAYSVLAERVLGLVALLAIGTAGVVAGLFLLTSDLVENLRVAGAIVLVAFAGVSAVAIVMLSPYPTVVRMARRKVLGWPLLRRLQGVSSQSQMAFDLPMHALASAGMLSVLFQLVAVAANYVAGLAVDVHPPVILFFTFVPLVTLGTMVPISLNGLGVREGVSALLWSQAGIPSETAVAMALVAYLSMVGVGVIGGAVLALRK